MIFKYSQTLITLSNLFLIPFLFPPFCAVFRLFELFCVYLQLAPIKLSRYTEDLLFYLYYTNGGDILQLAAAAEL